MWSAPLSVGGASRWQLSTDAKSNEITAIPELLDMLDVKGSTVTIDAMGCQTAIATKIIEKGAHYVLGLKGNQGKLAEQVIDFFEIAEKEGYKNLAAIEDICYDKGHGSRKLTVAKKRQLAGLNDRDLAEVLSLQA